MKTLKSTTIDNHVADCTCGKVFYGEYARIRLMRKLHEKVCDGITSVGANAEKVAEIVGRK